MTKNKRRGTSAARFLLFSLLLFALLPQFSFSKILLNQPQAGQMLELLVEGEPAPENVTLVRPDGRSVVVPLYGGQMQYNVSESGRWIVRVGAQELAVVVTEPPSQDGGLVLAPQNPLFAPAMVIAALVFIALAMLAVDALIVRPPPRHAVVLEKSRNGNKVSVRLRAGSLPMRHARVEDEVGPGWSGAPMRMSRARLEASQTLEMEYEWDGEMGEAKASFEIGRKEHEMSVRSGRTVLGEDEFMNAPIVGGEENKQTEKKQRGRKLGRI